MERVPHRAGLIAVAAVVVLGTGGVAVANNLGGPHRQAGHTYPEQGVTVRAASSNAADQADQAGMATPTDAIAALAQNRAAQSAFGAALTSGTATAELATVTEQYPVSPGVAAGKPYTAWVVKAEGPAAPMGGYNDGSGSHSAPAATTCDDVAIYSLSLQAWTELLRTCA